MDKDEVDEGGKKAVHETEDEHAPDWRTAGPWLNAPARLAKLVVTALFLSAVMGVLYSWGLTHYAAFIDEMSLSGSHFAFQVQPQEAVIAGAYVLVFFIRGLPYLFWYIALGMLVIMAVIFVADLAFNPSRKHSIKFFSKLPARLRGRRPGRFLASWGFSAETERAFRRLGWAVASYLCFAVLLYLLMTLLSWGEAEANRFGREAAKRQLATCRSAALGYADGKALMGELCGRIGNDYIMRVQKEQQPQLRMYVLVKEAGVKQVNLY